MSNRNKRKNQTSVRPIPASKRTRDLQHQTGHGFQEFNDLQDMHEFFTTDPDSVPGARFEPPIFKKHEMARSDGKRK